jgi:hypothetical protein
MRKGWTACLAAACSGWLFLAAAAARAESVYRCHGTDDQVAYQDRPCAGAQRQTRIELAAVPPAAPSPDYGVSVPVRAKGSTRGSRAAAGGAGRRMPGSYECRATNGEVFYRHSACPKSITVSGHGGGGRGGGGASVAVTATPLTRADACRRLAAAGSIGRSGRDRDERVTTYERNAGRDPCR